MEKSLKEHIFITQEVKDLTFLHLIRKRFIAYAEKYSFNENFISDCLIIINELSSNLVKHAQGRREILFRVIQKQQNTVLEIMTVDAGPQLVLEEAIEDGFSTSETLGTGLGSIKRLSDLFECFSTADYGNVFYVQKVFKGEVIIDKKIGWICTPMAEEGFCGDDAHYLISEKLGCTRVLVADGLGHGELAQEASSLAVKIFKSNPNLEKEALFKKIHRGLNKTRGAAVLLADIYNKRIDYINVGNIQGRIFKNTFQSKGLIARAGIVGFNMTKSKVYSETLEKGNMVVFHSDGVRNVTERPRANEQIPIIMASAMYSKMAIRNDDRIILVYKH